MPSWFPCRLLVLRASEYFSVMGGWLVGDVGERGGGGATESSGDISSEGTPAEFGAAPREGTPRGWGVKSEAVRGVDGRGDDWGLRDRQTDRRVQV